MTELYIIRHTQAEGNLYRAMQGHWDGDVTALGWQQIGCLAERFRDVKLDALYSSDLYRTRMTAGAITKYHSLPLQTDTALREINAGSWEGRFFGDLAHEDMESLLAFISADPAWRAEGAESYPDVIRRTFPALLRIAEANDGKTVAVVSHGVAIRCMLAGILGQENIDVGELPICGNTGVTHLYYDNGSFTIDYFNDCSHLDNLQLPVWERSPDLRGTPLRGADLPFYEACYRDAWQNAHGNLQGFSAATYSAAALRHLDADPGAVLRLYAGDVPAGLVDMDTLRGADEGYGWVSFLYLLPEYRKRGLGVQLLGRPLLHYKALGRKSVRLTVAEHNADALAFYKKWGFKVLSVSRTPNGPLLLMERSLEERIHV